MQNSRLKVKGSVIVGLSFTRNMWSVAVLILMLGSVGSILGQQQDPTEVAFSAGVTGMRIVRGGQKVVYDRIFTNIGSAYNSNTGVFTCPLSGLYVFQLHALAQNSSNVWLEMYHNYHYVISIFGHTTNDDASAGNSVILQLTKGDQVSVTSGQGWISYLYGDASEVYSTFSGYLISPVFQEIPGMVG